MIEKTVDRSKEKKDVLNSTAVAALGAIRTFHHSKELCELHVNKTALAERVYTWMSQIND